MELADLSAAAAPSSKKKEKEEEGKAGGDRGDHSAEERRGAGIPFAGLRYNIEVHLPATKDVEVYNAIFKSLKEHLLEN